MKLWRLTVLAAAFAAVLTAGAAQTFAAGLFGKSGKPEADPKKDYVLKESDGNWFVMVQKFSGEKAALQAKRLAYELRASYSLYAFVFKYDPDQMDMDALSQNLGKTKKFHYQTERPVEYAVLVGGFPSGEDPSLQRTLEGIRKLNPKSLKDDPQAKAVAARFQESAKRDSKYAGYGPLGGATPVPNPLLPSEFFNHKGVVDPFVAKLNSDSPYSLLNNKKMYTVRIATFSGDTSMKKSSESFDDLNGRLQYAGLRAAALCEALRNSGVEAWEFHDRDCSFVTVGSFDQYGKLQADGHTELNPQVAAIMKKYGGELVTDSSGSSQYKAYTIVVEIPDPASTKLNPKKQSLSLACDLRPVIIVVPQRSGEENVKKIALAQQQMKRANERKEAQMAAQSIESAENGLENAKFMNDPGLILTEEELQEKAPELYAQMHSKTGKASPAKTAAKTAATNAPYAANAQPAAVKNTAANAQRPATVQKTAANATQSQRTTANQTTAATAAQRTAANQTAAAGAQRSAGTQTAARTAQTAQTTAQTAQRTAANQQTAQKTAPAQNQSRTARTAQKPQAPTY